MSISNLRKNKIHLNNIGRYGNCNWIKTNNLIEHDVAIDWMKSHIIKIKNGEANDTVWLLEHKNVLTGGTSSKDSDLLNPQNIPVRKTGRGGQWTWHGPGQRVVYIMVNLNNRKPDVRWFISSLEQSIINTLSDYSIKSYRRKGLPGVWVKSKKDNFGKFDKRFKMKNDINPTG